ncbi:hypothetical protein [Micromonospora sp. SH-82]|uniref:hypothetical protein n=1 Tax=Micromonospora sp. SH-82 TaxID=3132938 RepID=UPI003EBC6401
MTGPVTNTAGDNSQVNVQAGVVHGDVVYYQLAADATPEKKFRVGVRYLDANVLKRAGALIEEAAAEGYQTDEVQFHRLLALLSKRPLSQLEGKDFDRLDAIRAGISRFDGNGRWTLGLRAVEKLLTSTHSPGADPLDTTLDALDPEVRFKIDYHLGVLLDGPQQDRLWSRSIEQATAGRQAGGRNDRIWMFFEPEPAAPRVGAVRPAAVPPGDWLRTTVGAIGTVLATGYLGWLLVRHGDPLAMLAGLACVAGLVAVTVGGADRHFRRVRRQAKDAALVPPARSGRRAPAGGFVRTVDRHFDHYFRRYVPQHTDRARWIDQTAGIRRQLRDELVDLYREQRIDAGRIRWLVRHTVADVRHRWEHDTLTAYRRQLRTPPRILAQYLGGLAAIALGAWSAVPAAVRETPLHGTLCLLLAVVCAPIGIRAWFRVTAERRRVEADEAEEVQKYSARREAYDRWQVKLRTRPTDVEVAGWLECDRRILVDDAMRHYRLKPSQVIAHAFIEAPAEGAKKARVPHGPPRYSRYQLLLFLLTTDGVRQVDIDLDFEACNASVAQRLNYRFDAVTSVRMTGIATRQQTFELTLVNGAPITVDVTESSDENLQPGEDSKTLSDVALDASGLSPTLHVLEGIAAEGKEWIRHQRKRADERLATPNPSGNQREHPRATKPSPPPQRDRNRRPKPHRRTESGGSGPHPRKTRETPPE